MIDHANVKLGKHAPKMDAKRLRMAKYFTPELPAPPDSVDYSRGISEWDMMLNDILGCCVIAAKAHALQSLIMSQIYPSAKPGIIHPSNSIILEYYEKWAGYNPSDPSTDQGMADIDALNQWRREGMAGYQLLAYADVDPENTYHIKQSIYLLGGIDIGLQMPIGWQGAKIWDVIDNDTPGTWGGHCGWIVGYDKDGLWIITWGELQRITWAGFQWACDEAHAIVVPDWVPPTGFDVDTLKEDLAKITG